jgi:hypothetical protein
MRIEDRGMICDVSKRAESERTTAFTCLAVTRSGSIIAGCQIGPAKNSPRCTIRLFRSRDHGNTWSEIGFRFETSFNGVPGSLHVCEIVEVAAGRLLLICTWFDRTDPKRPMLDPVTEGILHSRQLAAFSSDEGDSWSSWRQLDVAGLKGCGTTGPILQWPDGTIAYAFESYKEFDDPKPGVHGAWLMASKDRGTTFGRPLLVAQDPEHKIYYWDQRLCLGSGAGEFIGLFWTHDLEKKKDINVHLRRGSLSKTGLEGGPIIDTGIPGQISAPLLLPDGRLLAFVVNRTNPGTMTLWSSGDGGVTWPEKLVAYVHNERAALSQGSENIDFAQYWDDMEKWSFGHPAIRPLGDGRVLLAYYAGPPNAMSLHWIRVNVEK